MMFNERDALKLRLEQLVEQEQRFLKLFQEEREIIFTKLRELDEKQGVFVQEVRESQESIVPDVNESPETSPFVSEDTEFEAPKTFTPAPEKKAVQKAKPTEQGSKRGRKPTVTPEKEAAIEILKLHPEGMKGVDLQRAVEEVTGSPIANMTTFMKSVENLDPNVQKPSRGTYKYENTDSPFDEL